MEKKTAPPRGRRARVPREERRRQLLAVAAERFARLGFAGTTTREIAAAAETTETVLFRHFPTKQALYAAMLEHRVPSAGVERWIDELRGIADRNDDEALFGAVARAILQSYRRDPTYHRLVLFAALEDRRMARVAHVKYAAPLAAFLREYVARRQAEGDFVRLPPELVVHMILSVPAQFAQWTSLGARPFGLAERDVAASAAVLLAGLRTQP